MSNTADRLDKIRWEEIAAQLNQTAEEARAAGAGSEAEQVKDALDNLFAELKKLSDNAQNLAQEIHKKDNDEIVGG